MKKFLVYFSLFAVVAMVIVACNKAKGPLTEEEIFIAPINGIELDLRDNVYISQGASQRIIIEGQSNVIAQLNKKVHNGMWKIYFPDKPLQYMNLKIYITVPEIQYIGMTGPGIVVSKTMLRMDSLSLFNSGSGYIDIDAYAGIIRCDMKGKGDIFLKGTCEKQYINISGSGSISSLEMETVQCYADIPGTGNADVSVKEKLHVNISGAGSLNYSGNPEVESIVEGTGVVNKIR
jgi:hypothetical protein